MYYLFLCCCWMSQEVTKKKPKQKKWKKIKNKNKMNLSQKQTGEMCRCFDRTIIEQRVFFLLPPRPIFNTHANMKWEKTKKIQFVWICYSVWIKMRFHVYFSCFCRGVFSFSSIHLLLFYILLLFRFIIHFRSRHMHYCCCLCCFFCQDTERTSRSLLGSSWNDVHCNMHVYTIPHIIHISIIVPCT